MAFINFSDVSLNFDPYDYSHNPGLSNKDPAAPIFPKMVLGITYTLVFVICGVGNSLLCCVIVRFRRVRTTANLLIGSLALSDLIVAIVCVPFNFYFYMATDWPFGRIMCITVGYLKMTSFYVSVNSLLAIAIDRYIIIMHPLKPRMTKSSAGLVIGLIWLISMVVVIPTAINAETVTFYDGSVRCQEMFLSKGLKSYTLALFLSEFLLPFVIMSVIYYLIARKLWFRQIPGGHVTEQQQVAAEMSKKKTTRMLIIVVILFACCWSPYHISAIVRDLFIPSSQSEHIEQFTTLYYGTEALAMGNSLVNTFIYVIFNANMRKYTMQLPDSFRSSQTRDKRTSWHRLAHRTGSSHLRNSSTAAGRSKETSLH